MKWLAGHQELAHDSEPYIYYPSVWLKSEATQEFDNLKNSLVATAFFEMYIYTCPVNFLFHNFPNLPKHTWYTVELKQVVKYGTTTINLHKIEIKI